MQTTQVYAVERVYDDLRAPFVAKDIIKQLQQLDIVVGDVFNRLAHKVGQEKERVATIDRRIRVCQAKVNAITERRTSNKPTTVFSTSKYPAPKVLPATKTLFHDKPYADTPVVVPDADDDAHFLPAEVMPPAQRTQVMTEVLELFEKVNPYREPKQGEVDMSKDGLGRLPEYIPSVGSVLLFNSGENPYQKYTSWDNLLGTDYEEEEEMQKKLASAPKTLVEGDELPEVQRVDYDFRPTMGTVENPSAKMPTNLPLPNIAQDVQFTAESGANTSIAPSVFQQSKVLPDLPPNAPFADAPTATEPTQANAPIGPLDGPPPPPPPPPSIDFSSGDAPPPPPPPPTAHDDDDSAPPPPPPPMPTQQGDDAPPPPPPPQQNGAHEEEQESEAPEDDGNPLTGLLAQIRNPNIRLRKVDAAERKPDPIERSTPAQNKPLSIAEEMKQRMLRRQAAISGKQDKLEQMRDRERIAKPVEVMKAKEVTAATPPPPPPPSSVDGDDLKRRNHLPTVEMSDDESDGGRHRDADSDRSNDDETDFLAQIRNIKKKQEQEGGKPPARAAPPPPKVEESKSGVMDFESQMRGLRDRADSLSMSEASDWSDD
ncbi:hypothetical protein Poli38472_003226 [Pythium oligandrum]|uniref:WASH1 WAHD domain-containing protein n=1 Tax=Pythium oligandrum TaxID=41045 RepID=A0A8K1FCK7_PYTOL|nr:hypothetical protein Poli38472_003226 [Pythium oligandrum]|eukprot:TMW57301.1 hypothetical protein Poli38472_003226 [Pythium oligandrum]